jgi:hypothetical protein
MSSFWPNCFAASAIALADWVLMAWGSIETEELAMFISRFYDSVPYKGEAVVWIEMECGFGVGGIRRDAKWQAGFDEIAGSESRPN